ncbi:hypothetical protein HDV06_003773 [Boothiomyces sp. JEL0866]|nr:hypothetical protein HDV06_003773 [Boothiomyces sp. JEL0866]
MSKTRFIFPFDALLALGIIGGVYIGGQFGVAAYQRFENWGKPKRWNVDKWDRRMMERDSRLTGNVNFQTAEARAPPQFSRNSAWELEKA